MLVRCPRIINHSDILVFVSKFWFTIKTANCREKNARSPISSWDRGQRCLTRMIDLAAGGVSISPRRDSLNENIILYPTIYVDFGKVVFFYGSITSLSSILKPILLIWHLLCTTCRRIRNQDTRSLRSSGTRLEWVPSSNSLTINISGKPALTKRWVVLKLVDISLPCTNCKWFVRFTDIRISQKNPCSVSWIYYLLFLHRL